MSPSPRAVVASVFVAVAALAPLAAPAQPSTPALQRGDTTLLARLRLGGHVLACRHAVTDTGGNPRAADARGRERNITDEGVAQSKRIGAAIASLGIPIGTVLSSQMYRTRETAMHAFGRVEPVDSLQSPTPHDTFRRMLATPPRPGTNTVLVTHQGFLNTVFMAAIGRRVGEGDCVIVRPAGGTEYEVAAYMAADGWERLGR